MPEITLTDPNNTDKEPAPAFSPSVTTSPNGPLAPADLNGIVKGAPGRPGTPSSKSRSGCDGVRV